MAHLRIAMTAGTLPSDDRSGASFQVHYLANALVAAGHHVTLHSMSPRPADALYAHLHVRRAARATIWRWALALRSLDLDDFDVLHCHGDDCFLGLKRKPRHVRTLHGSSLAEARACEVWRFKVRMLALALGEFASLAVADLCIANSRRTMRYFPGVRRYIPCGVDLSCFTPGAAKSAKPSILFVGGMQGKKRGWLMLKTFQEQIRPALPDAELWVVSGEDASGPGVTFHGRVDNDTLVRLYQSAWVFCMPSSYEGFGVPYVEAMACGTPVVATYNDGAREVLSQGRFGRLSSDEGLGETLLELLESSEQRRELAAAGLERAQVFGWPSVVAKYLAAYCGEDWQDDT